MRDIFNVVLPVTEADRKELLLRLGRCAVRAFPSYRIRRISVAVEGDNCDADSVRLGVILAGGRLYGDARIRIVVREDGASVLISGEDCTRRMEELRTRLVSG